MKRSMSSKIKMLLAISTLLITTLIVALPTSVSAQSTDWPMFMYDSAHTGFSPSSAPDQFKIGWTYKTGGAVCSSPAIVDGKLYIGSEDEYLYCLNADTGSKLWSYKTGGAVHSSPAVIDGKVYFGSFDRNVYCLDASDGDLMWTYTTGRMVHSSPNVINGRVYINSNDKNTYCLDAENGDLIWKYTTRGHTWDVGPAPVIGGDTYALYSSSPAVVDDVVYVGSFDKYVYALDANDGTMIWEHEMPSPILDSSPTVADGKIFIGCDDYYSYCLDAATGAELWNTRSYVTSEIGSGAFWIQTTAAYAYGQVYQAFYHKCAAFAPEDGRNVWSSQMGTMQKSSVTVADGKVFTANHDRFLYMFDAFDGTRIQSLKTANGFDSTPVVADGKIFVGGLDGRVYCFVEGVPQTVSTLNVNVNIQPKVIPLGSDVEIQGWIMCFVGEWPREATVEITYTKPDASTVETTAVTQDMGDFYDSTPANMLGTWGVVATYSENTQLGTLTSNPQTFTVVEAGPTLTQPFEPTEPEEPIEPEPAEPTEAPLISTEVAIIAAVAIAIVIGVVAYWALKKRK